MMQRSWPSGHEHVILHHWVYYEIWLAAKKVIRGTGTKFDFTRGRKYSSELKTLWEMDDNEFWWWIWKYQLWPFLSELFMLIKKKVGIYINCHLLDVYIWISDAIMWPEVSKSEHHAPRGPPKHHLHDGAAEGRQVPRLLLHGQSPPLHQPRGHSLSSQDLQVLGD